MMPTTDEQPTTGEEPIRVLLVDDHAIIRDGLRDLIATRADMICVGDAATGAAALALARDRRPDVIVLDLDLGDESGLALIPALLDAAAQAAVIVLTGMRDPAKRDEAMEMGAKGVVLKERGATELLSAIEKVHRTGDPWFEPGAARRLLDRKRARAVEEEDPEAAKIATLTAAERELIACIGDGLNNREIAARMHIAESTVRNSLTRVFDKLGVKGGRLGLLVYAYRHGLVKPARPG